MSEAHTRIGEMVEQNRHACDLARLLSLAVPIEPALMRAMRLELLPHADVSAEADLWFGPLVETRSRDGIMLNPEVAEVLRAELGGKLAEQCWRITARLHDYLPPAVQLEEKLNFLSLDPQRNAAEISKLLQSALTALIGQGARAPRGDVANWAGRALPRLPQAVRATEDAAMLAAASDLRLGRNWTLAEHLREGAIPDWFGNVLPAGFAEVDVGVSATSLGITLDPTPAPGSRSIKVPATDPRVVQVSAPGRSEMVFVDAQTAHPVALSFDDGPIELTTLAGNAFTLTLEPAVVNAGKLPDHALACRAYANCNQALIVWQTVRPIEQCLGFALQRVGDPDRDPEGEILKNAIGFPHARPQSGPQPSTVWPIQRFIWIDRPPRRGRRYSYRITPVIGSPDKVKLARELQAQTDPVDVGVIRNGGPITALFNREPGVSEPQPKEARNERVTREDLGGEVRRALLALLGTAEADQQSSIHAALFLLDDDELIDALARLGKRARIVLSRDPAGRDGGRLDRVRKVLRGAELYIRHKAGRFSHTNFMVVVDGRGGPRMVWTGSASWSSGSLYGQDSNALIVEDAQIAARYLKQWDMLRTDPSVSLMAPANAEPATFDLADNSRAKLWFAPVRKGADLDDVRRYLERARSAILFAIGPRSQKSVVDDIVRQSRRLHVAGVARSFDAGKQVTIHRQGRVVAVVPERVPNNLFGMAGLKINPVNPPIGSRLIVIDPFTDHSVVMTGSHTLSESASRMNDDDLLIIEGNRALAAQCAVHIQGLIDHYSFRARVRAAKGPSSAALRTDDGWQEPFMSGDREQQIRFWMGTLGGSASASQARENPDGARPPGSSKPKKKPPAKSKKKRPAKSKKKPPAKRRKERKKK